MYQKLQLSNSIRIMKKSSGKKSKAQFQMIGEELIGDNEEIQTKKKRKSKGKKRSKNQDGDEDEINQDQKNNKTTAQVWTIYRKFFAYTLKRWKWGLCCIIITIISAFFQSILPYKLGQLLDLITNQTSNPECTLLQQKCSVFKTVLTEQMLIIGGLTVLIGIGTFVRYLVLQLFQEQLGMDLKCQIFNIFIQNDINFFQIHESNALVSRLSNDVNQAKSAISNNLTMLLRNVILCLGSFIVLMGMSWRCTLIMLSIIPPYSYITLVYKRKAKQLIKKRQDVQAQITVHVGEKFAGIHLIKSSNTEELQMNKYKELNTRVYQLNKERTLYQGIHSTCSSFLPSLGSLFVLIYAGTRLLAGEPELSAGELTSFILYCSSLASSAASISNSYTNIINGTSAIQRVFEMMSYKKLIEEDKGDKIDLDGAIHFENVSFSYPSGQKEKVQDQEQPIDVRDSIMTQRTQNTGQSEQQKQSPLRSIRIKNNSHKILKLFNNINFNIKRGEYVGFVGQSGSGKSTILKLIQHFYRIQDGQIFFGGKRAFKQPQNQNSQKGQLQLSSGDNDLSLREITQEKTLHRSDSLNIKYLRKQIGVVSQEATLFNGTIEENITYGLENYTEQQLLEAAEKSGCLEFLNNHNTFYQGFQTIVGERGNKLSGGQKQRVSIARALLKKPKILLFDEATSALDSHSESVIKQTIEGLSKSQELTIVVIAHRLSTVVHCDRLFVMKEGNIVQVGSHKELMNKRGYYYQLIQKQLHEKDGQTLQKQLQFS